MRENIIARIAIDYSLQTGRRFTRQEFGLYDSKGKEYKDHILFGDNYRDFYIALICQHYEISKDNEDIPRYVKLHLDHGLEELKHLADAADSGGSFYGLLVDSIERGTQHLNTVSNALPGHTRKTNPFSGKSDFGGLISLEIGHSLKDGQPITLPFNGPEYNNNHIAIAGNSGCGKTQFILDLIAQITEKSNQKVNFIYLDFKGLKNEDLPQIQPFFQATKAR